MEKQNEKGDIVYLNSGSPSLTITEIVGDNATVTWEHDKEGTQLADFPLACLSTTNCPRWGVQNMKQSLYNNDLLITDTYNQLMADSREVLQPLIDKYGDTVPRLELVGAIVSSLTELSARKHIKDRIKHNTKSG